MKLAFRMTVVALTVLAAQVVLAQSAHGQQPTLAQFIGMSNKGGSCCAPKSCCPTPVRHEPKCCPQPVRCEPKCCPAPTPCEPKCCPQPSCASKSCCQPTCHDCCRKEYPLEKFLNGLNRSLCGSSKHCKTVRDPRGYDLWPCVGQCCNAPATYGVAAPPAMLHPEVLYQHGDEQVNPFQDDPNQPPRPPAEPTHGAVRGARLHPALQRASW